MVAVRRARHPYPSRAVQAALPVGRAQVYGPIHPHLDAVAGGAADARPSPHEVPLVDAVRAEAVRVVLEAAQIRPQRGVGELAPKAKPPVCAVECLYGVHRCRAHVEAPLRHEKLGWRRVPANREAHRARRRLPVRNTRRAVEHVSRDLLRPGDTSRAVGQARAQPPQLLSEVGSSHRQDEVARQEARLPRAAVGRNERHQPVRVAEVLGEARGVVFEVEHEAARGRCRQRLPQRRLRSYARPLSAEPVPRPVVDEVAHRRQQHRAARDVGGGQCLPRVDRPGSRPTVGHLEHDCGRGSPVFGESDGSPPLPVDRGRINQLPLEVHAGAADLQRGAAARRADREAGPLQVDD
mmetsp:Transcript_3213/g.10788  ORF Transcript_3213/g.10788 Transcript_3213/m.10788 type:complete len:352 (+) Transcript_3213:1494-2549(+)